jgi:hypothetical protein
LKIVPKGWQDFQHYKDRRPPWIRLHRTLLDNQEFNALPPMACKVLVLVWLVCSETVEGVIDADPAKLAFRMRLPATDVAEAIECLMAFGFLLPADETIQIKDQSFAEQLREVSGFGSRHITDQIRREVWERDGGKCRTCGAEESIEFDHMTPVSKGGTSEASNVQLLCRRCNRKKRTKTAEQLATPAQPQLSSRTHDRDRDRGITEKPSQPSGPSPSGPVFGEALALLIEQGMKEPAARAFLGMLVGNWEESDVLQALMASVSKQDIRSYALKILKGKPKKAKHAPETTKMLAVLRERYGDNIEIARDGRSFWDPSLDRRWNLKGDRMVVV